MKKVLFVSVLLVTLAVAALSVEPPVGSSVGSQDPPPPRKMTAPPPPPVPMPGAELVVKAAPVTTYYYYKDAQGEWRWRLQAANGRIIAESADGYDKKSDCLADITFVKNATKAPVKME